jgi:PAS domain S-box-containing protein
MSVADEAARFVKQRTAQAFMAAQTTPMNPAGRNEELLRVLMVEDSAADAERIELQLTEGGRQVAAERVTDAAAMQEALASRDWDIILAGHAVPGFDAMAALKVLQQSGRDIPFIILSDRISDEQAVALMRAGAHDYLRKKNLLRLLPIVEREIHEAQIRRQSREARSILRLQGAALNSAANSIVITNREGAVQWVNSAFTKMTGYSASEAIGQNPRIMKSGKHDEQFYKEMWNTIVSGSVWRGELINRRKDGSLYVEEMTITPVSSDDGTTGYFVAVKEDISARKQVEETLKRQAEMLRLSFDAIIVWRLGGGIESWNHGAEQLYGYSEREALGRSSRELLRTIHRVPWPEIEAGLREYGSWEGELCHTTKQGREVTVATRHQLITGSDGVERILETNRDITDRKRAEQALIRSEKLASVGRMAATIAHEINNPLAAAMNALFLVRTDPALPESVGSNLALAEREVDRAAHILNQTLGFSREAGNPTTVDLAEVLDHVLELYAPKLRNLHVSLHRSYRSGVGVRAFETEIQQIASNLIANSIDALPKNGNLYVRLLGPQTLQGNRRMVRMTIADDGEGIAEKDMNRLFEPFFTTKQSIGTGLGLWVSGELVKKNEGKVRLKSRKGRGTVVTVWLPVERRSQERRIA